MKLLALSVLAFASAASADVCTPTPATPACPTSGVQILDDTYPVQSLVISQLPMARTEAGRALPRRTMLEAMRAFNFELDKVPYMIYPARSEDVATLRAELLRDLVSAGVPRDRATELVNQRLRPVDADPYTWQQDYFEASFDRSNGQPQIRYSEVYTDRMANGPATAEAIGRAPVCQLSNGENLRSFAGGKEARPELGASMPTDAGEYGGNIEGLPGGLCLVGNNATNAFATQICGNENNIVRAEVNWLEVGHVDEVFKVVPRTANDGRPSECAFSILAADTELGLSLLGGDDVANTPVLDRPLDPALTALSAATPGYSRTNRVNAPITGSPAYNILCKVLETTSGPGQPQRPSREGSRVEGAFLRFFIDSAYAQDSTPGRRQSPREVVVEGKPAAPTVASAEDERIFRCVQNAREVSHREYGTALRLRPEYEALRGYNAKIQAALNRSKQTMFDAIIGRLPQCRPFFPNVDSMFTKVPNYFSPPDPNNVAPHVDEDTGELLQPGAEAMSLFPNPTNGVLLNRSLLLPGPVPQGYQNYLQRTLSGLGLTGVPMDTWDYAHAGSGNLHCSSHTLPYCRPGGR